MFEPNVGDPIVIGGYGWRVAEHPAAPGSGIPYGQTGRAGTVFRLRGPTGDLVALKVFTPHFRHRSLVAQADLLRQFAALPGLRACHRAVLTPQYHTDLLLQYPDLTYAALMPWINGQPWSEIVRTRQPLTQQQSHALAANLLSTLIRLENEGIAHGDLSGSNLIIDGLQTGDVRVELVDVEQLYAPTLPRPENVPAGSPGYAHATAGDRPWRADMDRFSGTILLAEILGWCDERVREAADSQEAVEVGDLDYGETYFAEDEMQQDCPRYRLLRDVLDERWGAEAVVLLDQAWFSQTLAECPPFTAGQLGLPDLPPLPPRPVEPDNLHDGFLPLELEPATVLQRAGRSAGRPGRQTAALVLLVFVLLIGAGGALALNWPLGGESLATPTVRITVEALPTDAPAVTTEPAPLNEPVTDKDSDGDGLTDEQETQNYNTDPANPDSDGDGLSDGQEVQNYSADPNNPDTDGDGLSDGQEVQNYSTDPNNPDSEGDGLTDGQEAQNYNTDPNNPDSDGDGLTDGQETQNYSTDPNNQDSDGDGLTDREELLIHRTDPNRRDSDGDGTIDGAEIPQNTDPLAVEPQEESLVTTLQLLNPVTGRTISRIEDGDTISLRQSGCGTSGACNLNVEAIVEDSSVESVLFKLDGEPFWKNGRYLENSAPYYMAGDTTAGPQRNWNWAELIGGQHTIEAQPCDRDSGEGACTIPLVVSITVTR